MANHPQQLGLYLIAANLNLHPGAFLNLGPGRQAKGPSYSRPLPTTTTDTLFHPVILAQSQASAHPEKHAGLFVLFVPVLPGPLSEMLLEIGRLPEAAFEELLGHNEVL